MDEMTGAAYAAAEGELLSEDQAADETMIDAGGDAGAEMEAQIAADPVLAEAPRTPRRASFQERIDEVTRARREAERERDYWREHAMAQAEPDPEAPPHPRDYERGEGDAGYIRDQARFEAREEIAQVLMHQAAQQEAQAVHTVWHERQAQFAATAAPDYQAVFDREWVCSPTMADAIRTSEDGPAVAYHLASNPAEARRIAHLAPLAQVRALGRIEGAVAQVSGGRAHSYSHVSNAPAPPPMARGAGVRFRVSPDTDDFASFDRAY